MDKGPSGGECLLQPADGIEEWVQGNWAQRPREFRLSIEGASIACRGWNLEAEDLPGIVLVHGFRAHAQWWDHIAPALTARHRVIAFSMSGMGDSEHRATYARKQWAREILAVASAMGFAPATIIAHSFGTICALLAAKHDPAAVRRLIAIDSAIPDEDEPSQIPYGQDRTYPDAETAVARFRLIPPGKWPRPSVLRHIARESIIEADGRWRWKFDPAMIAPLNREIYMESLQGITVPVDVLRGEHSEIMPPHDVDRLRQFCPRLGNDVVIPASHHHVPIEQPASLAAAILALLANDRL
jgi:pimeloyl-ACP methyl ester carboxylesterase